MAAMMRHGCGTVVDADEILCPGCGGAVTEDTLSPVDEAVTAVLPAGAAAAGGGERVCATEWCRRPIPPGATICDGCGRPVPADPAPAPGGPSPAVGAPAGHAAARRSHAGTGYGLVLPGAVRLVLTPGVALELGRAAGPALVRAALAPLDTVSRRHASVTATADGVVVRDFGSMNGTFVDDVPVTGEVTARPPAVLRLGQSVSIGLVEVSGHE